MTLAPVSPHRCNAWVLEFGEGSFDKVRGNDRVTVEKQHDGTRAGAPAGVASSRGGGRFSRHTNNAHAARARAVGAAVPRPGIDIYDIQAGAADAHRAHGVDAGH